MPLPSSVHNRHPGLFSSSSPDEEPDAIDLLFCGEDAGSLSEDGRSPAQVLFAAQAGMKCPAGNCDHEDVVEEAEAAWVEEEADECSSGMGYGSKFLSRSGNIDPAARLLSVAWIHKVAEFYQLQPITTYLAVNYMDRFLSCLALPQNGGWPMQLLAVACLSLAAKIEETFVPSLLDLQVEGAAFVFLPRTVQRMELLVLDSLKWRLRSVTPFTFLRVFACKADPGKSLASYLVSRATQIVLATTQEIEFLGHCPSAVAAAAIACAAREAPALSSIGPESAASWCPRLTREGIINSYQLMQGLVIGDGNENKQHRHQSRIPPAPQRIEEPVVEFLSLSSSLPLSSSSKRRKLSSCGWVDDAGKVTGGGPTEEGDDVN